MPALLQRAWWTAAPRGRELRGPWSILRRGLGAGALGGALLGGGLLAADTAYRSWPGVGLAAVVGALVALPAALAAVIGYQAVEARGVRAAWLTGSVAAAVTVVLVAAVLGLLPSWFVTAGAAAAFVVALVVAPVVPTRRTSASAPRAGAP